MSDAVASRIASIVGGDRTTIARAISSIDNGAVDAQALIGALATHRGRAHVIGITGAPGAGKSTLIDALVLGYVARDARVAVVAVDPSSPITGGAVLGDRIRMGTSGSDSRVFIRSLASRGQLGGVTRTTAGVVDVLDAAGFDPVIVETVGAGQSDVAMTSLVDTNVVVCAPGLGDDVQAIKAGVLEIADVLVVSKGDTPLASRTQRDLADMLRLRRKGAAKVPVVMTAAAKSEGIDRLIDAIEKHAQDAGRGHRLRRDRASGDSPMDTRGAALHANDPFMQHCGIELVDFGAGYATLRMVVRAEHMSFRRAGHGGAVFALADGAFGLASNSHDVPAAGIDAHIAYHAGVKQGDVLTARAVEISRGRRIATYRIDIDRADGKRIATFTGTVFRSAD